MPVSATSPLLPEAPGGAPAFLSLHAPLRALVRRPPLTVPPDASVRETLCRLDAAGDDAAVVVDPVAGLPLGIVTLRDVLHRIALADADLEGPVAGIMTGGLVTLPARATLHQGAVLLARRGMHHLVLVEDDGRLGGVVTQTDLYGFPAARSAESVAAIAASADLPALAAAAAGVRRLAAELLAEGVGAEALCQYISALNDLVSLRAIDLVADGFELPYVPWCWLVFGSEGRLEQTLATDQDNGLIFAAPEGAGGAEIEALRQSFLPFAKAVNQALDACGFPLCPGNIMAGNPAWCLSLGEWQDAFGRWMVATGPEALLNSTIFFDFRPLYGQEELAERLRDWLQAHVHVNAGFLRAMTLEALSCEPPLGFWRDFSFEANKDYPHTLDLKLQGVRPFVDAARINALAHGIAATNTAERLRAAAPALGMPVEETAALVEALFHIQRLRLKRQLSGGAAPNRVDPDQLHDLDRHILREAFKQGRNLQQRLKTAYGI